MRNPVLFKFRGFHWFFLVLVSFTVLLSFRLVNKRLVPYRSIVAVRRPDGPYVHLFVPSPAVVI